MLLPRGFSRPLGFFVLFTHLNRLRFLPKMKSETKTRWKCVCKQLLKSWEVHTGKWEIICFPTLKYRKIRRSASGDSDCETVLDQLYQAYAESHESDPPEISEGFKELEEFLCTLPLDDNNAVFNLCCSLCTAWERKAFIAGLLYGAHLMIESNG